MCAKIAVVVLFVFVSVVYCAPSPGLIHGYHALPAATSYSSRIDIHGPEYIKTYAAPVIAKTVVAAPIVKTVVPAVSYHHEPLVGYSSYGYGLGHGLGHSLGHGYGGHGYGGHGYGDHGYGLGHSYGLGHGYGLEHGLGYAGGYGHGYEGHYL